MPAHIETLASYVPTLILRRYASDPTPLAEPLLERFPAAVLFADISGFTSLAERLAQRGPVGAEELTKHLNNYFGGLIASIVDRGGDIVKFAGDALLAIWPVTEESGIDSCNLEEATYRAAQCSLFILNRFSDYVAEDVHLTLHIGIAAGETLALHVGGVKGRWEFLIAGAPLVQMARAEANAKSGEVCISPEGWAAIAHQFEGTLLESGDVRLESAKVATLAESPASPCRAEIPAVVPEMTTALRRYIPHSILAYLDAEQIQWLAELRRVTVLFVKLPGLDWAATDYLDRVHQALQAMQKAVYQYEGTIRQFMVDDKGSVLVAAFGMPSLAHENDAERALLAALAMRENLCQMGVANGAGVTTGWVYCGSVGSERRCEHTIIGDTVNLAARLMVAARDEVLCDEATYQAAKGRLWFDICDPIRVKGKQEPVPIYRPSASVQLDCRLRMPIVGRISQKQRLAEKLEDLRHRALGGVVAIAGEAGIGKSRLVEDLCDRALAAGVTVLKGAGDAIEKSTPYRAWRGIFSQLLQLDVFSHGEMGRFFHSPHFPAAYGEAARKHVLAQLASEPEWLRLAPLLNAILPLNFPENELTERFSSKVRADNTHDLLIHLLQVKAKTSPCLLILEDAHWMDSASWALTLLVRERVERLLLVVATRPLASKEYQQLLQAPGALQLDLDALSAEDAVAIATQRLGANSLPEPVAAMIREKAQGNPFFCEELASALRDAGLVAIADGACCLNADVPTFEAFIVPDTVQGIITSRMDRLIAMQQLTLKVASAIGRSFSFRILRDIYPIEADKEHLPEYLQTLEKLNLTQLETSEPDLTYRFKHVITQEVAYNLMLFSQRRQLHEAVAQWYERDCANDLSPFYPILAYHWSRAVEPDRGWSLQVSKAIDYLEKAGEQALRSHSLQEAVRFFSEVLALARRSQGPNLQSREVRWERQLGEAYLGLGQLLHSREHLARAAALSGRPLAASGPKLVARLLGQILQQALHLAGIQSEENLSVAKEALLETAKIYDLLAEIYYHANEIVAAIYCALRALNLCDRAGASPELARAYANSCFAAGVIPLHSLAEAYSRRGRAIAQTVDKGGETEARVAIVTSAYGLGVGQWQPVQNTLDKAKKICFRLGDWHQWGDCVAILAKSAYFQGNFPRGVELWSEGYAMASRSNDILQQAWGLNGQAEGLLRQGEVDRAVILLEESLRLFAQNRDRVSETATYGMLAIARLYQGDRPLALEIAMDTQARLAQISSPNSYYLIEGYASVAEVYLTLWETSSHLPSSEQKAVAKRCQKACQALNQFARVFPIGKPRSWLWQGVCDWLRSNRARARSSWHKSLATAEELGMPYERGLAYYQSGRHATGWERQQHLTRACEIFSQLNAVYNLERARIELDADFPSSVPRDEISLKIPESHSGIFHS